MGGDNGKQITEEQITEEQPIEEQATQQGSADNLERKVKSGLQTGWEGFTDVLGTIYHTVDDDLHYKGNEQNTGRNLRKLIGWTAVTAGTVALANPVVALFPGYCAGVKTLHYIKDRRAAKPSEQPVDGIVQQEVLIKDKKPTGYQQGTDSEMQPPDDMDDLYDDAPSPVDEELKV